MLSLSSLDITISLDKVETHDTRLDNCSNVPFGLAGCGSTPTPIFRSSLTSSGRERLEGWSTDFRSPRSIRSLNPTRARSRFSSSDIVSGTQRFGHCLRDAVGVPLRLILRARKPPTVPKKFKFCKSVCPV